MVRQQRLPVIHLLQMLFAVAACAAAAEAEPPQLHWSQIGTYTVPSGSLNWCFNPAEYNGELFVPVGDYCTCAVLKRNGLSWSNDFLDDNWGDGCDFENLAQLRVFNDKLHIISEVDSTGNMGIMVRNAAGTWSISHQYGYTPDPLKEMGAFGSAIWNGKLYTGVNPYPAGTLTIYQHDGLTWTPIKYFNTGEQLRAWSLGSDGSSVYVGIGVRARNNAVSLGIQRYNGSTWTAELAGLAMHSMAYYKGSMYAGGNGPIYKRSPSGTWSVVFNTGQRFVASMAVVQLVDGSEVLYAGSEDDPHLYSTTDGQVWHLERDFGSGSGACNVGQYQHGLAVSVCYPEEDGKPVRIYLAEPLIAIAPIISEVQPDPQTVPAGDEYVEQLTLTQGFPDPTWIVVEGPSGLQVDQTGRVSGWTPGVADIGEPIALRVRAENSSGSDIEAWQVRVRSRADFDGDDDVDQSDFGYFQACLNGTGQVIPSDCGDADLDPDGDVDHADLAVFLGCLGGAAKTPGC